MSYEQALQRMRGETASVPAFERVRSRPGWRSQATSLQWTIGAASFTAALAFGYVAVTEFVEASHQALFWASFTNGPGTAALLPFTLLIAAGLFVLRRRFAPQMLARAIWWSGLIVGTLMAYLLTTYDHRLSGTGIALACGVALLGAGKRWLDGSVEDAARGSFRPAAFRGLLTVALVMAFADAHTLAFSGLLQLRVGASGFSFAVAFGRAWPTFVCAAVMGLAVWGLLRLRTWALFLNLIANFVIAGIALHGHLRLSIPVAGTLAATAVIQAFLPVPILALAAGGDRADRSTFLHHGGRASSVLILVLMVIAGVGMMRTGIQYSGWLSASRAFERGVPRYPMAQSSHLVAMDLRHHKFRGANFQGGDFTQSAFDFGDLSGADLSYVTFDRTTVDQTKFVGADLSHASVSEVRFIESDLRRADLRNAKFTTVEFAGADLTGARLDGAAFEGVTWRNVTCPDRSNSDEAGRTCVGHGWAPRPGDAELVGRYVPTSVSRTELDESVDARWALAHLLGLEDMVFAPPYGLDFSIDEEGVLRLGPAVLLHVTPQMEPRQIKDGIWAGKVFVPQEGPRAFFIFDAADNEGTIQFITGTAQLKYVRE
jgi:hypothetical protein